MKRDQRTGQSAFTLTELLVVMGIMVLLSAILIPAIGPMFKGRAIKSSAQIVQGAIYKAKSLAAANGKPYYVCLNNKDYYQNYIAIFDIAPDDGTATNDNLKDEFILLADTTMFYFTDDTSGTNSIVETKATNPTWPDGATNCVLKCLPTGEIEAYSDFSTVNERSDNAGGGVMVLCVSKAMDDSKIEEINEEDLLQIEILELTGSMNVTEP